MVSFDFNIIGKIKYSLDNLPEGISLFNSKGKLIFQNRIMYELVLDIIGHDVQNLDEFNNELEKNGSASNVINQPGVYLLPSGHLWVIRKEIIIDKRNKEYTQITAGDVTELYIAKNQLEQENERLRQMNRKVALLSDQIKKTVREEETLAMKVRMHDDMGRFLISAKKTYFEGAKKEEIESQIDEWRTAVEYYSRATPERKRPEGLKEVIEAAEKIGVEIEIDGVIPQSEIEIGYLAAAIRECATNCANHAKGDRLFVSIDYTDGNYCVKIHNNGQQPISSVREGGGMMRLRQTINAGGGRMSIRAFPKFLLQIEWREKDGE